MMNYKVKYNKNSYLIYEDNKRQTWDCISIERMEELYPNGGFLIIGELKEKNNDSSIGYLTNGEQQIEIYSYHTNLKKDEYCVGFICVYSEESKDAYIRIIKKKNNYFLLISLIFIFLLSIFCLWLILTEKENEPILEKNAISYHYEGLKNHDQSNISIPLFNDIKINNKTMISKTLLPNPEGNPSYFQFYIFLQVGNKQVYKSNLVEPGTAISKFKLSEKLQIGSYPAVIKVKTFSLKNHEQPLNGGEINVNLIVEEED